MDYKRDTEQNTKHNWLRMRAATNENACERVVRAALSVSPPPFNPNKAQSRSQALRLVPHCCAGYHWLTPASTTWLSCAYRSASAAIAHTDENWSYHARKWITGITIWPGREERKKKTESPRDHEHSSNTEKYKHFSLRDERGK